MKSVLSAGRQTLVRLPFTLVMLLALAGVAVITNSHSARLHPAWLQRLGHSAQDLSTWRLGRLLTSAIVTHGGAIFWQAFGMIALAVGVAEWLTGSLRTFLTFWGVHLLTLLAESWLVTPLLHLTTGLTDNSFLIARDVGPSAGYFGCLGLVVWQLPRRWRLGVGLAIMAGLGVTILRPLRPNEDATLKILADMAHLIAFPLGCIFSRFLLTGPNKLKLSSPLSANT